jgi:predicted DNA-binding WGR domain protein
MRIYMQQLPTEAGRAPRFLHLHIQEDLIDGWNLIKETGYQGSSGKLTRTHFDDAGAATEAMLIERDKQLQRGYRVVFVEGQGSTL